MRFAGPSGIPRYYKSIGYNSCMGVYELYDTVTMRGSSRYGLSLLGGSRRSLVHAVAEARHHAWHWQKSDKLVGENFTVFTFE